MSQLSLVQYSGICTQVQEQESYHLQKQQEMKKISTIFENTCQRPARTREVMQQKLDWQEKIRKLST